MSEAPLNRLREVIAAHRILVKERVLDAFGHVSIRDPQRRDVFWLARACPPSTVETADMIAHGLDGEPCEPASVALFAERYIHSAIYAARDDVNAVCHHHAAAIMPFCIGARPLVAVSQTGAFLGEGVPLWDSAAEFGDTGMLVNDPQQAASLARDLAEHWVVLMRGHGAVAAGRDLKDLVFKAIYSCREAEFQRDASLWQAIKKLSPGEIAKAGTPSAAAVERCWTHWMAGLSS